MTDHEGNFYNENYRSAKAEITYICRAGRQTWHPRLTFFGFRYIMLDEFPKMEDSELYTEQFTANAVYSDMEQTGHIASSDNRLNRLVSNIMWGQKGNFLDVPTDCPQRDERLGWTGDAQVFVKAACYNFDTEKFYEMAAGSCGGAEERRGSDDGRTGLYAGGQTKCSMGRRGSNLSVADLHDIWE